MKKFIKKYNIEILSIVIPIVILLISCAVDGTFPFGAKTLARYDGYYQYPGFTSYYKNVLLGHESLFYSFKGLLGFNFYATSIYYLFNPSNLLCVFFPRSNLLQYYTFIVYLRIALCGLTMSKYLKYKFKDSNNKSIILISVAYALMGYNVCYFFNYMYYDAVVLLPITMIGLEKLINNKDSKLYILTLSLSIISNFYIGYMVCIFSLLYFIYNYILLDKIKRNKKIIIRFIISSLLVGLICMFILLPEVYDLLQGKAVLYNDPNQTNYFEFNTNFLNFFYKSFSGSMRVFDVKYGSVNSYCSLFAIVMVILFFFNKEISKKEKVVTLCFILFFLLSISFNLIDYAWHLFQRPIWYPNRYIFTFSFFLLVIAYKNIKYIKGVKIPTWLKLLICITFLLLTVYPAIDAMYYKYVDKTIAYALGAICLFQYVFLYNYKNAKYLILGVFFIEITFNTILTFNELSAAVTLNQYNNENEVYESTVEDILKEEGETNNFYRVEMHSGIVYNNGLMYNYNGINMFNSLRNAKVMNFFGKYFGYVIHDNANMKYNFYNVYMNAILGVKYFTGSEKEGYYEKIRDESFYTYKNNDALSLGYMVSDDIYNYEFELKNKYNNTAEIVNTMLGYENKVYEIIKDVKYVNCNEIVFKDEIKIETKDLETGYVVVKGKAKDDGFILSPENYLYSVTPKVYINGVYNDVYAASNQAPLFVNKGDTYEIVLIPLSGVYDLSMTKWYFYNLDTYQNFIKELKQNGLKITSYKSDSNLEGVITSTDKKSVLFTTIPYDEGWNIYVDNKKVDYNTCYDTFICLDLKEGEHTIKFRYIPKYLILGSIISFIAIITSIIYCKKK